MNAESRADSTPRGTSVPAHDLALGALLLGAVVLRVGYALAQPATDPGAGGASLDGAYYVSWGRALLEGGVDAPGGAYYLAPLYAWFLAGFFALFGDGIGWLYLLQHLLVVATALLLALVARRLGGPWAGVAAAGLLLAYHPSLYFASRPVGETLSLFLLALSIWLVARGDRASMTFAGISLGLGCLARPNLLLVLGVGLVLGLAASVGRRGASTGPYPSPPGRASWMLVLAGAGLVLAPVALRNWLASGHFVPVSANAGITAYHGNGPGAEGIGVLPAGFSGTLSSQREEATRIASARSGRALDDVEADRWWGRQALRVRLSDPVGSLRLLLRRSLLTVSSRELSLDYAPAIDGNPWRHAAPLPFGLLLGLAAAGLALVGFRGSGGWIVWGAIAACAATPILFYVSSRYRLPTAVVFCLPAGLGLAALTRARGRRLVAGLAIVVLVSLGSWAAPVGDLARTTRAGALANRGALWKQVGEFERAEKDLREALAADPESATAHFNLGVLATQTGRTEEAEQHYATALAIRPSYVDGAQNLSNLLISSGRAAEAIPLLRSALVYRPNHAGCWTNLVVALHEAGREAEARNVAAMAGSSGVTIPPGLVESLEPATP